MNAYESVCEFIETLNVSIGVGKTKKRLLLRFCSFIESSQNLEPGRWNFDGVIQVLETSDCRFPLTTALVINFMIEIGKEKSPRVYNDTLATLKQFFNYLVTEGVLPENPAFELMPQRVPRKDKSDCNLLLSEAKKLLVSSYLYSKHRNRNLVLTSFLLTTATRIGELVNLKVSDLKPSYKLIYAEGKSNSRKRIMLSGLNESIDDLLADPLRKEKLQDETYLLYSDKGGPLKVDEANELLKGFAKEAEIHKDITSAWLRRTYGTLLARAGFNMREIQTVYDHDNIKNTHAYVQEIQRTELREIVNSSSVVIMLVDLMRKRIMSIK